MKRTHVLIYAARSRFHSGCLRYCFFSAAHRLPAMSGLLSTMANADPADRAQMHRLSGKFRVHLPEIGFWQGNCDNSGIFHHHVHEVANDFVVKVTRLERYGHVSLVSIPQAHLAEVLAYNNKLCERCPLLPSFSKDMKYVLIPKTHFTFGHKPFGQGGRYLFRQNEGGRCHCYQPQA